MIIIYFVLFSSQGLEIVRMELGLGISKELSLLYLIRSSILILIFIIIRSERGRLSLGNIAILIFKKIDDEWNGIYH